MINKSYIHDLLKVYYSRHDLQKAYAEAASGDLKKLLQWASYFAQKEYPEGIGTYDHIYKLMRVYYNRPDLQKAYPEAENGSDLTRLATWAVSFGSKEEPLLIPFIQKYSTMQEPDGVFSLLNDNNKLCMIVFSGFGHELGMNEHPFHFLRTVHCLGFDILHLNDVHKAWYHFGANGMGDNIDELVSTLQDFVKDYDKVVTFGNSMGGYASILIGSLLDADLAITIVPATFIDKKNCELYKDNRHPEFREKVRQTTGHPEFLDLKEYFTGHQIGKTCFLCFYGDANRMDEIHCKRLVEIPSFYIFRVKGGEHSSTDHSTAILLRHSVFNKIFRHILNCSEVKSSLSILISELENEPILEHVTVGKAYPRFQMDRQG